ncbi:hypothetical protein [Methanococcoides burtonii]|uniref:hypothetical protein n=1 Tax=Methanococcoides burtonii TaxID=29291 RepID=UPI000045E186|nr:hypothetical protein [Methanococcoides burtonii]
MLEIDGYDLDEFLEKRYKFFVSKKRTDSFLRWYQVDWEEEEFLQGFLAVFSSSQSVDIREILRNLLKSSLQEEHNKIWADITKFDLERDLWNLIKRYFGYGSEVLILKKLFLSFIITPKERDYFLNVQDIYGVGMAEGANLAAFVALCSGALGKPVTEQTVILGTMTIGGAIQSLKIGLIYCRREEGIDSRSSYCEIGNSAT